MIAFVAAEGREFRGLERHVETLQPLRAAIDYAKSGTMQGRPVALLANGPGAGLVKTALQQLDIGNLEVLVSIGFCGALADELKPSDVFVATSINGTPVSLPRQAPPSALGPLLSVDHVITTAREKRELRETGAHAVEMEAAGVLDHAREHKMGFCCIRVVTDTAEQGFGIDFNRMRDRSGRFSRIRIVAAACRHPFRLFPELMQMDQTCKRAAVALGDFIADCQF